MSDICRSLFCWWRWKPQCKVLNFAIIDQVSNVFCWTFGCRITNGIELLTTTTTTSYNMLLRQKMVEGERGKRGNAESIETYMIGVLLDFWINYHIIAARRLYKSHCWEFLTFSNQDLCYAIYTKYILLKFKLSTNTYIKYIELRSKKSF